MAKDPQRDRALAKRLTQSFSQEPQDREELLGILRRPASAACSTPMP